MACVELGILLSKGIATECYGKCCSQVYDDILCLILHVFQFLFVFLQPL